MSLSADRSWVTFGDFLDVYHKLRQKGVKSITSKLKLSGNSRVASKWDFYTSSSDFWIIPEIVKDWNKSISGDENTGYEDYVAKKYFSGRTDLKILSVGCGEGNNDRKFAKYSSVKAITGIDISEGAVAKAHKIAQKQNLPIEYIAGDFFKLDFEKETFDVILFSSSLHHFPDISSFLKNHIKPLLKDSGLLVVFEYCGPNRLQWRKTQLNAANSLLKQMPKDYKTLYDGKSIKRKVYRPGLIRMFMVDPSEAPDSENLVKGIHDNFTVLEEAKLGWNLLHILLKGIAHNFVNDTPETKKLLAGLIAEEKEFMRKTGENDAVFGVYQKD